MNLDLSSRTGEYRIRFGRNTIIITNCDNQINIEKIYDDIHKWFHGLPKKYHIEFYSVEAKKILPLTEDVFTSIYNPFRLNPNFNNQDGESITDCVELFIVDDTSEDDQNNSQSDTSMDTISLNEMISFYGLDGVSNNKIAFDDLDDALLSSPSFLDSLDEGVPQNNISTNDNDNDMTDDNNSAPSIYPQYNDQTSIESSHEYQLATESNEEISTHCDRIIFSHDVHPKQKNHYSSNKFKINDGANQNNVEQIFKGGISYIQGQKTQKEIEKKMKILPCIRLPRLNSSIGNGNLLLYAVYEEQENGRRIWYKDFNKGFLSHDQLKADAQGFNPIKLALSGMKLNVHGDIILEVYMLTKRNKQLKVKQEIHRMSEQETIQIHKAKHIVSPKTKHILPVRLLCVLEIDNRIDWNTFGLSNFIQPPEKNLQPVTINNITQVRIESPALKRKKV